MKLGGRGAGNEGDSKLGITGMVNAGEKSEGMVQMNTALKDRKYERNQHHPRSGKLSPEANHQHVEACTC